MSNGPKLRANPPGKGLPVDQARLEKLMAWTEEPARAAAQSLDPQPVKNLDAEPDEPGKENREEGRAVKPAADLRKEAYPWDGVPDDASKQFNVRLPLKLVLQLKYLGDTTFDSSMSKIVQDSLQKTVKKLLAERNIK